MVHQSEARLAPLDDEGGPIWPGLWLGVLLIVAAIAAFAVPLWLIHNAPSSVQVRAKIVKPHRIMPRTVVPVVDPVELQQVSRTDAVAFNETIPFSKGPNPAARPFRFGGTPDDHERAVTCLAAAVLFEAGDNREGQQSVAQVVLNRARHPAFPPSVCGVVFQGSERRTGCQFTFTCDGALARRYPAEMWNRARDVATAAIDGAVYAPVGQATHYHTNWVVPYWSSSLDKIVEVRTHLFFRWTGWWGTPPAFSNRPSGAEPVIRQLAAYSYAHSVDGVIDPSLVGTLSAADIPLTALPPAILADANTFLAPLDPRMAPAEYPALASRVCGDRAYCKVLGWNLPANVPQVALANLPSDSPALQTMTFSYLRDRDRRFEKALWNCDQTPRPKSVDCMRRRIPLPAPAQTPATPPVDPAAQTPPAVTFGPAGAIVQPIKPAARAAVTPPTPTPSPTPVR